MVAGHKLRQRAYSLTLPSDVSSTTKQNFVPRMLFTDMYWPVLPCKWQHVCFVHFMYYFLLCCNASAFVICAIKNYLLTMINYSERVTVHHCIEKKSLTAPYTVIIGSLYSDYVRSFVLLFLLQEGSRSQRWCSSGRSETKRPCPASAGCIPADNAG